MCIKALHLHVGRFGEPIERLRGQRIERFGGNEGILSAPSRQAQGEDC